MKRLLLILCLSLLTACSNEKIKKESSNVNYKRTYHVNGDSYLYYKICENLVWKYKPVNLVKPSKLFLNFRANSSNDEYLRAASLLVQQGKLHNPSNINLLEIPKEIYNSSDFFYKAISDNDSDYFLLIPKFEGDKLNQIDLDLNLYTDRGQLYSIYDNYYYTLEKKYGIPNAKFSKSDESYSRRNAMWLINSKIIELDESTYQANPGSVDRKRDYRLLISYKDLQTAKNQISIEKNIQIEIERSIKNDSIKNEELNNRLKQDL